ncbi:LOW QUALITY PROTEIN: hypothetical protein GGTG_00577 [Gaeumannomyces tritici R3-111a-1]|uniref:Uncharacterized protein n=1 Tax=Gaeumannomyces tritici (strain R3-111a-1) TaxID=644352 RepID=J3NH39_GAET3|nr:LOW QUALITY PROTEIN: hypothetical protein GGTG_00577 [Gaeumannomyces tritici R3-111a-1]EJT80582.1 LOW QUALITY PROTEIN: hypothetical protein GGTG_00577 [Gaeumannomyces tritici R3-111a-1]
MDVRWVESSLGEHVAGPGGWVEHVCTPADLLADLLTDLMMMPPAIMPTHAVLAVPHALSVPPTSV